MIVTNIVVCSLLGVMMGLALLKQLVIIVSPLKAMLNQECQQDNPLCGVDC